MSAAEYASRGRSHTPAAVAGRQEAAGAAVAPMQGRGRADWPAFLERDPHLLRSHVSISMRGNRGVGESYASVIAGVRTVITLEQARGPQGRRACSLFTGGL